MDHAIQRAVRTLLAERGYRGLTVDAVAEHAGVGKAAIYRRHASKAEMVFAALVHDLALEPPADTGSLRGDLTALVADVVASLTGPGVALAAPDFIAEFLRDGDIADRFQRTYLRREADCVREVLRRAVDRGELTTPPDPELLHATVLGTVFAWLFILRRKPDAELAGRIATLIHSAMA